MDLKILCKKFIELSQAKLKEGIFVGPQILEVFEDPEFENALNALDLRAWHAFKWICSNFFENFKSNSNQGVAELLVAYKEMECCISLKMHFLHSHLEFFPENLRAVLVMSRVKNFAKISNLWKKRYKGVWDEGMMGDNCWMLYCDDAKHP